MRSFAVMQTCKSPSLIFFVQVSERGFVIVSTV